ncbi:MAG: hypothetical protein AAB566_00400 [Patescibacteria group bacterium]
MEKITLKPVAKELVFKGSEPDVQFDAASYAGATNQEKNLGALFVLSHLKQKGEDLNYLVSLISSLAKREFYSLEALAGQNPKQSFERTLKKLNEVLEDFFKNKEFQLNLGLAAIAGENIYIARLGKFKVALARDGEYIDILNNLDLFNKDRQSETQFSNIISGKLKSNDKLFAYFPIRPVTSREKMLNPLFLAQNQNDFSQKLAVLADSANNFACCGVHIAMQEIKEIPVFPTPMPKLSPTPAVETLPNAEITTAAEISAPGRSALQREVAVTKRNNLFNAAAARLHQLRSFGHFAGKGRAKVFFIAALVIVAGFTSWVIFGRAGSSETRAVYNQASANLKLARSKLTQNQPQEARTLLYSAISQITGFNDKKIAAVANDINQTLDTLDHASNKQPTPATDANPAQLFANIVPKALQEAVGSQGAALYEDNLYILSETTIYKYPDAVKGGTRRAAWGTLASPALAIAVDGNIFAVDAAGKLTKYFKGKKEAEYSLGVTPSAKSKLLTDKNSAFIYLTSPEIERVYVFDKTSGELKTTYKLGAADSIQDITVAADGTIWILASDNKVWQIKP